MRQPLALPPFPEPRTFERSTHPGRLSRELVRAERVERRSRSRRDLNPVRVFQRLRFTGPVLWLVVLLGLALAGTGTAMRRVADAA